MAGRVARDRDPQTAGRECFTAELPQRHAALARSWQGASEAPFPESLAALRAFLHVLASQAEANGYGRIAHGARSLERSLDALLTGGAPSAGSVQALEPLCADLAEAMLAPSLPGTASPKDAATPPCAAETEADPTPCARASSRPAGLRSETVHVALEDQALARELAAQLEVFGHKVVCFEKAAVFAARAQAVAPAAAVLDLAALAVLPPRSAAWPGARPALIVLAEDDSFQTHLTAVRQGADAFFRSPASIPAVVERLEAMLQGVESDPYRILIVDRDQDFATSLQTHFKGLGWTTRCVRTPESALEALAGFRPDLLLVDEELPGASGLELATILRQRQEYLAVPVIYLVGEDACALQFTGPRGDGVWSRGGKRDVLCRLVRGQARRYREMRGLMQRDGLTGLLNHSGLKQGLAREVERARRANKTLGFALLDLDHFEAVNEAYGYQAGDKALKSLANLLRRRVRKTDLAGRYGGEEIGLVFLDVASKEAILGVLEKARENFARLCFDEAGKQFSLTVSGGVAFFPDCFDHQALVNAAADALRRAKAAGRDRIVF